MLVNYVSLLLILMSKVNDKKQMHHKIFLLFLTGHCCFLISFFLPLLISAKKIYLAKDISYFLII